MNPFAKYRFSVEWGGTRLGFTEVTGLEMETEVIEYREGIDAEISKRQLPGMRKYSKTTMKRGIVEGDNEFHEWWLQVNSGDRRDVQVTLLDELGDPVFRWILSNAFVNKLTSTDLKADGNEIAIETVEVTSDSIQQANI